MQQPVYAVNIRRMEPDEIQDRSEPETATSVAGHDHFHPEIIDALSELLVEYFSSDDWQNRLLKNQDDILERFEQQQQQTTESIESISSQMESIHDANQQLTAKLEYVTSLVQQLDQNLPAASSVSSPLDEALQSSSTLQKYQIDNDDEADAENEPAEADAESMCDSEATAESDDGHVDGENHEDTDTTEKVANEPDEIAELRRKLEEKLRKAEIEISIERAKIARLRQRLDEQKTEMERDFARREQQLLASDSKNKKGRWKKFLALSTENNDGSKSAK